MLTLFKSKKFQQEYDSYRTIISEVSDEKVKAELEGLLIKLVGEVKAIDLQHQELLTARKLPSYADDSRTRITEIRRQLDRLVSDWKEAHKA